MRKWIPITATAVVVTATAGVLGFTWHTRPQPEPAQPPTPPKTVEVVKTDLSDTKEFKGDLGFGATKQVKGRRAGTITWLPAPGAEIDRGAPLYKVDNQPVALFFGDTPLWRKLDAAGIKGPDVKIVKDNLVALGYVVDSGTDEYTAVTMSAVKRWQKSLKAEETGHLDVGDVMLAQAKVRVQEVAARLSDPGVGELMSVTAPGRAVTASVDTAQTGVFKQGAKVTVLLPNGTQTTGTVGAISTNAKKENSPTDGKEKVGVAVEIGLDDVAAVGDLDTGPVRIRIASDTRKGVLAVPVTALLALREGGYAVQVREGDQTALLPVQTGMFAGGLVEISGGGIREGLPVVTTS